MEFQLFRVEALISGALQPRLKVFRTKAVSEAADSRTRLNNIFIGAFLIIVTLKNGRLASLEP
jgi:hypothetical protein